MATIHGTNASEYIAYSIGNPYGVTEGSDLIFGYGGHDTIHGYGGDDLIFGGAGEDVIYGHAGDDNLWGDSERDYLVGGGGNDNLWGGEGDDSLHGDDGNDTLVGGAGADVLQGDDYWYSTGWGEPGIDTASYADSPAGVTVSLVPVDEYGYTAPGSGGHAEGDRLIKIENLTGSQYADYLTGDDGANQLVGLGGNDLLKGGGGADTLLGGTGNDTLKGGGGSDFLSGGEDSDTVRGGDEKDWVYGGAGNDMLYGENGNDFLDGGAGRDNLSGGSGADAFGWYNASDTGITAATADVVTDFNRAEGDFIYLRNIDANVYEPGDQDFHFIGDAAFSGTPGEVRFYHSGGNTYIEMQTGTSVDVEGVIRLDGIHWPDQNWFL